jgi:hypothetical protein
MPRELQGPFAERKRLQKRRDEVKQALVEATISERRWLDEFAPAIEAGDPAAKREFAERLEAKYLLNYELGETEWKLGNTPDALANLRAAYDYGSDELRRKVIDVLRDIQQRTGLQLLSQSDLHAATERMAG